MAVRISYWLLFAALWSALISISLCILQDGGALTKNGPLGQLWAFLNTNFFTALSGAFAGAYGAQYIAEKTKMRESLLSEIRNTNAAISLSVNICNSLLILKKQHVKRMVEKYFRDREFAYQLYLKIHQGANLFPPEDDYVDWLKMDPI